MHPQGSFNRHTAEAFGYNPERDADNSERDSPTRIRPAGRGSNAGTGPPYPSHAAAAAPHSSMGAKQYELHTISADAEPTPPPPVSLPSSKTEAEEEWQAGS